LDIGTLRGLVTAALLLLFVGLVLWAWSGKRKADFERAAQTPLEDDPS
jgi:cbb3-type cytochrome oxidase subunit 3